jgi:hypothetical protein
MVGVVSGTTDAMSLGMPEKSNSEIEMLSSRTGFADWRQFLPIPGGPAGKAARGSLEKS